MKSFTVPALVFAAVLASCDATDAESQAGGPPSFLQAGGAWESMGVFDVGDVNMNFPRMAFLFVENGSAEMRLANDVPPNFPTFARWDLAKRRVTEMVYPDTGTLKYGNGLKPMGFRYIDGKFYAVQSAEGTLEYYTKDGTTLSSVLERYLYPNSTLGDVRIADDKSFCFSGQLKYQGTHMGCLRVYNQATGDWDAHLNMQDTVQNAFITTSAFSSVGGSYTGYLVLKYSSGYVLAKTNRDAPLPSPSADGFNYYQLELLTLPDLNNDGDASGGLPSEPRPGILHSPSFIIPVSLETTDSWYFAATGTEWYWPDYSVAKQEVPVVSSFRLDKASKAVEPVIRFARLPEGASRENLRFGADGSLYTNGEEDHVFMAYKITPSEVVRYPIALRDPGEDFYYTLGPMEIIGDRLYVGLMRPGRMYNANSPFFELVRRKL